MADITPLRPGVTGLTGAPAAPVASTPAGDKIIYGGGDIVLEFQNGHASPITVNMVPVQTNKKVSGVGNITVPTRTLVVANATAGCLSFKRDEIGAYVGTDGKIPITYTSGNALLTVRAFELS